MYRSISVRMFSLIFDCRFLTAKTNWISNCVYVFGIWFLFLNFAPTELCGIRSQNVCYKNVAPTELLVRSFIHYFNSFFVPAKPIFPLPSSPLLARFCKPCFALQKQSFALKARHKWQICASGCSLYDCGSRAFYFQLFICSYIFVCHCFMSSVTPIEIRLQSLLLNSELVSL